MGNLGFSELVVIGVIALLVVGPKRLPEIARALGEAFRTFQDALKGGSSEESTRTHESDEPSDRQRQDPT